MTRFQPQGSRIVYNMAAPGQKPFQQLVGLSRMWAALDPMDKVRIKKMVGLASDSELLELDDMAREEARAARELQRRQQAADAAKTEQQQQQAYDTLRSDLAGYAQPALDTLNALDTSAKRKGRRYAGTDIPDVTGWNDEITAMLAPAAKMADEAIYNVRTKDVPELSWEYLINGK